MKRADHVETCPAAAVEFNKHPSMNIKILISVSPRRNHLAGAYTYRQKSIAEAESPICKPTAAENKPACSPCQSSRIQMYAAVLLMGRFA